MGRGKSGGRHDGAFGGRREQRREEQRQIRKAEKLIELAEQAARKVVRQTADGYSESAVHRIGHLMQNAENEMVQLAAAREMLRLANAYPTKIEQNTGGLGAGGALTVILQQYNGELPAMLGQVAKLPPQAALSEPPETQPAIDAEFNVGEPARAQ